MPFAYAGTHRFGALVLNELLGRGHTPAIVLTRPDRPSGRHGSPQPSAVKKLARVHDLPVLQPETMDASLLELLREHEVEVVVVCAHGQIVRPDLLDALPVVVAHPSAVPRWRGAAPVERALMAGETRLGMAVLRMTAGVDEGPIGDLRWVEVSRDADAGQAYDLLAGAAAEGIARVLAAIADGTIKWEEQRGEASYAAKLERTDRALDFTQPAQEVVDRVRALSPWMGARAVIGGRELTVWRALALDEAPEPSATRDRLVLAAGSGWVEVLELQAPGGRRMTTAEYLRGAGRWLTTA